MWLPPQITRGRVRKAVSQAADWLHDATTRGVTLAGAVGTGNTVVRVLVRRTIMSRGDVRRAGAVLSKSRTGHMTPLLASRKEAGGEMGKRVAIDAATSGSGKDGLNLCEGAGEGTAALAKTARPSARSPLEGQNQRYLYQGQHNLWVQTSSALPTEALGGMCACRLSARSVVMCACRLSARSVVRGAWVAPPPARILYHTVTQ